MCDYGNEINELLSNGWSYEDAVEYCKFISGESDKDKEFYKDLLMEQQEQM